MIIGLKVKDIIGKKGRVKLGSQDGSAFVYCGKIEDMSINEVDACQMKQLAHMARKRYMNYLHSTRLIEDSVNEYEKYVKRNVESAQPYGDWLSNLIKVRKGEQQATMGCLKKILDYKSIAERTIVDAYPSISEKGTVIIIVTGDEQGRAWTTEEYNNLEERRKKRESIESK